MCREGVAFRVITGSQKPDPVTIARFRRRHERELAALFTQGLRLCGGAGPGTVSVMALDGMKVKAHAPLAANRTTMRFARKTDQFHDIRLPPEG
ncbi:hypothetical protein JCM13210_21670 [Thermaerobacter litoralis]